MSPVDGMQPTSCAYVPRYGRDRQMVLCVCACAPKAHRQFYVRRRKWVCARTTTFTGRSNKINDIFSKVSRTGQLVRLFWLYVCFFLFFIFGLSFCWSDWVHVISGISTCSDVVNYVFIPFEWITYRLQLTHSRSLILSGYDMTWICTKCASTLYTWYLCLFDSFIRSILFAQRISAPIVRLLLMLMLPTISDMSLYLSSIFIHIN